MTKTGGPFIVRPFLSLCPRWRWLHAAAWFKTGAKLFYANQTVNHGIVIVPRVRLGFSPGVKLSV